ncbi:MAG: UDP-N-acetylmuramoyl-L-alanine--D-glutamate ligase [Ruminococcaceae bacterium]|nr:UDP-N-acetylmuramoyl-L-alanine--D-glutamate ligase [Oscillospiraceae bacterium]
MNVFEYKKALRNKKISVIGVGVSNAPLIRFLVDGGAIVSAHDKKNASALGDIYKELSALGVSFVFGEGYLKEIPDGTEIIFKTPGLRGDVPELLAAKEKGIEVTSEMELFFELCPCEIIAVTGSDGKTTTTTLVGEMLKKEGYTCHIGGNIGKPLVAELENMKPDDKAVLELSSFQLFSMKKSPKIAVVTNVTPNHLDWHKDFEEYIESKKNIMKYQDENSVLITNYSNAITKKMGEEAKGEWRSFSSTKDALVHLDNNEIFFGSEKIINASDIIIPGIHNIENYMAAIAATKDYVSRETVEYVAKNFGGVPHRIELVRTLDGVRYYNDSIASSPARTTAGLSSFNEKVILIAGGYDKKIPFDEFGEVINERVKKLVLVGLTSEKIEAAVKNASNFEGLPIFKETDFEHAVKTARNCAESGDIVILSPACASFDLFKNFEERGNLFKKIVMDF